MTAFRPSADEPAVRSSALRALVEQARRQRVPSVRVSADEVRAAWARARWRQRLTLGAMAVAAALLVATVVTVQDRLRADPAPSQHVAHAITPSPDDGPGTILMPTDPTPRDIAPAAAQETPRSRKDARLAEGVRVESLPATPDAVPAPVIVTGAWSVEVASGAYAVEVPTGATAVLEVLISKRVLRIEPGTQAVITVEEDGEAALEVRHGSARWADEETAPAHAPTKDRAAALARKAEAQLEHGDRLGALESLDQLVRKHPNSSSAKAAVLDLARLHRAAGHPDAARCAYTLYLDRWPTTRLRGDIDRALSKLGSGPDCRGLDPK
jgi:hypothetical protein